MKEIYILKCSLHKSQMQVKPYTIDDIKQLMSATNTTQAEIAKFLGATPQTLVSWINGKSSPKLTEANRMLTYLNDKAEFIKKHT